MRCATLPRVLHPKRIFQLLPYSNPLLLDKTCCSLNRIADRFGRGTIFGAVSFPARSDIFLESHNMMAFINPHHVHRKPILLRPDVILAGRLEDIKQPTISRQRFSKCKTDEQFFRCIRHFRLELTAIGEGHDNDGLVFPIDEKERRAHQENRHEPKRDNPLLFLPPIAHRYSGHRYSLTRNSSRCPEPKGPLTQGI